MVSACIDPKTLRTMSSESPHPTVAPGWYPDPRRQYELRWWDGTQWTEHTHNYDEAPATGGRSEWISKTVKALTSRAGHVFTLALLLSALPAALMILAVWWAAEDIVLTYQLEPTVEISISGYNASRVVPLAVMFLVTLLTSVIFGAAVRRQTVAASKGRLDPWSTSLAATLRRLPRLVGVWITWSLVLFGAGMAAMMIVALIAAAAPALIIVAAPAGVIGFVVLLLQLSLVPAGAALAPKGVNVWRQAWRAAAGRRREFLVRGFLIWSLTVAMQFFVGSLFSGLSGSSADPVDLSADVLELTRANVLGSNVVLAVASGLIVAMIGGFAAGARATGYGLLYDEVGCAVDPALVGQADSADSAD